MKLVKTSPDAGRVESCPQALCRNAEQQGAKPLLLINDMGYQLVWSEPQETPRAGVPSHRRANWSSATVSLTEITPPPYSLESTTFPVKINQSLPFASPDITSYPELF